MKNALFLFIAAFMLISISQADEADFLFEPPHVWRLDLTFIQPNWFDSLIDNHETETYMIGSCIFAGESYDTVGVRFKGNSSFWGYLGPKKSIKVKFNEYNDNQRPYDLTTINFNNSFKDPTMLREKLFFDFLKEELLICPRANFSEVYINGQYWGLYVMSETVNKRFITHRFGENEDGDMFKGDPHGTLEWLGTDTSAYKLNYEIKNNEEEDDWSDLIEFIDILNNSNPDSLDILLPQYIDMGEYARCQAANNLFVNLDSHLGTGHNYYLYHREDQDRFYHVIWDVNEAFGNFGFGMNPYQILNLPWDWRPPPQDPRPLVDAALDITPFQSIYLRTLRNMVNNRFDDVRFDAIIDSLADLIRPYVYADSNKMFSSSEFETNLDTAVFVPPHGPILGLKEFVGNRRQSMIQQLNSLPFDDNIIINELLADNETGLSDENSEYEDWLEIKNISGASFNIGGYFLSDDLTEKTKWQIPDTVIAAGECIIIFCDNDAGDGPLHATFKFSASGEEAVLTAPDSETVIDYISFGEQSDDISFGRFPDGGSEWIFMHPTPYGANTDNLPPIISNVSREPSAPEPAVDVYITAEITDNGTVDSVLLVYDAGSGFIDSAMYDDGLHNDGGVDDGIYGAIIPGQLFGTVVVYYISAFDDDGINRKDPIEAPASTHSYLVGGEPPQLYINEFLASNDSCCQDPQGDYDDWLEIYNAGDESVELGGMYLTDELVDPTQWQFPDTVIEAGGLILVWADDDEGDDGLHTNFKLGASGEEIGLFHTDLYGNIPIDTLTFGAQTADISYGRCPDGGDSWMFFDSPTPGMANVCTSDYEYLPGDVNMFNGIWPPVVLGSDVTYLVNYFRGITVNQPCLLDDFWVSADVNGDCSIIGSDVIRLVNYFRGSGLLEYCSDYNPAWPPVPDDAPDGWPNCETPPTSGAKVQ